MTAKHAISPRICQLDERMARIEKRDRRVARLAEALWMPARIAAVIGQIYWATWHQVFRYPPR